MRAILVVSFAITTAIVSTAALAAGDGQGILKRRIGGAQQTFQPVAKPVGQTARFNTLVRPPVQTIAPPIVSGPKAPAFQAQIAVPPRITPAPTKVDFARPVVTAPKPVTPTFRIQPAPKPVVSAPVIPIKQELPANRQIQVEGPQVQQIQLAPAPAPTPAPAPKLVANDGPEATGTLQAEVPNGTAPVAPPADAQQLIEGDTAAAPQAEEQVAPQPAPVAPTVTVKPTKKIVRYYQQDDDYAQDDYTQDDYSYQPQVRYSNSYGGGYGGDGCE